MEKIKKFITDYFEKEAQAYIKLKKPDINAYNEALQELHSYVIIDMYGRLGLISLSKPKNDSFYERHKNRKPTSPRQLFKISHYKHNEHKKVWVCYTTVTNPDLEFPVLTHALFVIKIEGEFKVARSYIYSSYKSDGLTFDWSAGPGLQDLTFESLGELIEIERYLEPLDFDDSLKLYSDDI